MRDVLFSASRHSPRSLALEKFTEMIRSVTDAGEAALVFYGLRPTLDAMPMSLDQKSDMTTRFYRDFLLSLGNLVTRVARTSCPDVVAHMAQLFPDEDISEITSSSLIAAASSSLSLCRNIEKRNNSVGLSECSIATLNEALMNDVNFRVKLTIDEQTPGVSNYLGIAWNLALAIGDTLSLRVSAVTDAGAETLLAELTRTFPRKYRATANTELIPLVPGCSTYIIELIEPETTPVECAFLKVTSKPSRVPCDPAAALHTSALWDLTVLQEKLQSQEKALSRVRDADMLTFTRCMQRFLRTTPPNEEKSATAEGATKAAEGARETAEGSAEVGGTPTMALSTVSAKETVSAKNTHPVADVSKRTPVHLPQYCEGVIDFGW